MKQEGGLRRQWKKKPNVRRGKKAFGFCNGYKMFGIQKDPLGTGIGTYTWNQGVTPEDKKCLNKCACALVKQLELSSKVVEKHMSESNTMKFIRQQNRQEGMREDISATGLSIGYNYWSQSHKDYDFYFTRLTVLAPENNPHTQFDQEVIYYFVFPTYEICVPMKTGDVLLFNLIVLHSCSNPRFCGSYIMSANVLGKTT